MPKLTPHLPADSDESQVRMSFGEHLEELRKRLIRALLGSMAGIMLCIYYSSDIVQFLLRPYRLALKLHHYPQLFSYSKPAEPVISYLTIGLKAGLVLSSPWIIYQLWLFVAAGLYQRERRVVYRYIGPSAVLFLIGVAFFYFVVLPLTLNFFIGFTNNTATSNPQPTYLERWLIFHGEVPAEPKNVLPGDQVTPIAVPVVSSTPPAPPDGKAYLYYDQSDGTLKLRTTESTVVLLAAEAGSLFANVPRFDDYMTFVTWTGVIFGLAFEMPMIMLVIVQIGLLRPEAYRKSRKYAYFGLLIVSMIIAPSPDVVTPLTFFIPLIGLYEGGVLASTILIRRREQQT